MVNFSSTMLHDIDNERVHKPMHAMAYMTQQQVSGSCQYAFLPRILWCARSFG